MDYKCFCGANLRYSQSEDRWLCPNGHEVYTCKNCKSQGKSIPLQWIAQYQRWYCYECQQYAAASEELQGYKLGIPRGSRVDEFCLYCRNLEFTQNGTHLKCRMGIPRFWEPAISDVTIRPTGSGKGVSGLCAQSSSVSVGSSVFSERANLREHIENLVKKQIKNHEMEAAPIEMYRLESTGTSTADLGMNVFHMPVNRDNVVGGRQTVTVDAKTKKIWVHLGPKQSGFASRLIKLGVGLTGYLEDMFSPQYLRDSLKRDIETFAIQKIWGEEEPAEFWQVLDRGAKEAPHETLESASAQPELAGPRIELYELKYRLGRFYAEYYTGGRADSETKTMSAEPLRTSLEELQTKRAVAALDHQTKTVWLWLGKKSSGTMKRVAKGAPRHNQLKTHILTIIGTRIAKNVDDYECVVVEERKEPDQFKKLFQK